MAEVVSIPVPAAPVVDDTGRMTKPWYQALVANTQRTNALTRGAAQSVDLTAEVSGILPVPNGGTGKGSVTAYQPIVGGTTTTGALQSVAAGTAGLPLVSKGSGAKPAYEQMTVTDWFTIFIEYPQNKSYYFLDVPYDLQIVGVTTRSSSGTCTLTTKKNVSTIPGLSNSVSTTKTTQTPNVGSGAFSAGDDLTFTVTANSSCLDLQVTVEFTRSVP